MGGKNSKVADADAVPKTASMDPDDASHPDNKALKHEGWDDIRDKKRHCTDCLCIAILVACWIAMTVVGFMATGIYDSATIKSGNPIRLTNAIDFYGDICGYSSAVASKPYGYYLAGGLSTACVHSCPSATNINQFICVSDNITTAANNNVAAGVAYTQQGECMYAVESVKFMNRCLPNDANLNAVAASFVASAGNQTLSGSYAYEFGLSEGSWFYKFAMDIYTLRGYVFGFGIGVATGVSFLYAYFLRVPGVLFIVVWSSILSIFVLLLVGSFLLWSLSRKWSHDTEHSNSEVIAMQVFAYTGMALTVLYLCLLVVLRSRIQLSIGIIKESARAVASMPILIFMPVVQVIGIVAFLVPWTIYVVFLASSGELQVVQTTVNGYTFSYRQFSYDTNTKYTFLYMLFCWFWTSQFVVAFGQMTIALAIVAWYFNRNKASVGNVTFLWAVKACARYHMGTVAYGALVIAIIQTIRSIIAYFQRQAKNSKNKIMEYVLCCLQCCMWCLEKVMKFINKNAYIQTAIYSYSFCKASRNAFFLLLRNILRVAAVNMVSSFVLFIGKLLIPALTTFILYLVLAYGSLQMNSILNPLVITFILAYFVSSMFNEIFGMAIETILCCYIADEEMFIPEKRFAEGPLKVAIHATPAKQVQTQQTPQSTRCGLSGRVNGTYCRVIE